MQKLLTLIITLFFAGPQNGGVHFVKGLLANAVQKADSEGKPVMIDFITDWCRWCDTLDTHTYSDPTVAAYINSHVIPIKIDAEKGEGIEIAKKYGVKAYPTILLMKADGEEIDRMLGYIEPKEFFATLEGYVTGKNTLGVLQAQVEAHPDDAALRYALAKKYEDRYDMAAAGEHFKKFLELDPSNTLGHNEEARYALAASSLRAANDPAQMISFIQSFPQSERKREALSTLWRFYLKANDGPNAKRYLVQYMETWPNDARMMNNYAWRCAEQGINLDHAEEVVQKAVDLAPHDAEKASYLDTYAHVKFAQGKTDQAIALEEQALELAKNVPGEKMKPYEESMAKFRAALKPPSSR